MDNVIRKLLKSKGFSNDMIKAVEEKTKKSSEEEEMVHRLKAEALAKTFINASMPELREMVRKMEAANNPPSAPKKTIITPD